MSQKQKQIRFQDYQFTATKDEAYSRSDRYVKQFLNKNLLKKKDGTLGTVDELCTLVQQANINIGAFHSSSTSSGSTMGAMLNHTISTINLTGSGSSVPIVNTGRDGGAHVITSTNNLNNLIHQTNNSHHHHPPSTTTTTTPTTTTISVTSTPTATPSSTSTTNTTTPPPSTTTVATITTSSQNASDTAQIDIEFHLSYTQLVTLPPSIFTLIWIQKLVLTHHNIKTLSEDIGKLTQLQVLVLENNRLIGLPQSIGDLVNLKRLEADNNHLVSLCSLERLSKLEVLSVNNNKLTLLPTSIASLTSLKTLNIKSNPIITPPSTVVSKGLKDIVSFLRELETGARPCLRSKLIVLGDPGVGKTSVVQSIKGKKKKTNTTSNSNVNINGNNSGSEVGIEIDQYDFDAVFDEDDKKRRVITLSTWDIANQDVYFASSQLFDSERSVYIVVFNLNNDDFSAIEYWLHCIMSTSPNSPIVLVGTHIDAFENLNVVNAVLESVASRFQKRFTNIQAIISVSCTTGYDVDKLRQLIEDIIKQQPYLKEKVPSSFFTLEEALIEVKKKRIPPVMMWQEYINLANICNLKDSVQIQRAIEFLHNIGSIVYFNDLNSSTVGKMVILDQQWIINCMSSLITSKLLINNCNGIVRQTDLELVWKAPTYPEHLHPALLSIMQAFEICRPLSPSDLVRPDEVNEKEVTGDRNLVPNLLSDNVSSIVGQWDDFIDPDTFLLNRQYHLPFLPEKFFGKLIIHLMNFTKVESCQKRAVIVRNQDNHEALIELKTIKDINNGTSKKILTVDVRGLVSPVSLLRIVTDTIESLFSQWYRLDIKRYISCYECAILYDKNPTLFTIEECELAVIDGKTVLTCQKSDSERVATSHRLKLDKLAPDISMMDIPIPRFSLGDVKISKEVGRGAFGIVYEAEWMGEYIALKRLLLPSGNNSNNGGGVTSTNPSGDQVVVDDTDDPDSKIEDRLRVFREFRHEVYYMSGLNHPNVMKISGFCIQPLCMALEYVRYGSLYSLLSNSSIEISWGLRLQIATEIAKGMQHLHSHNPPVIHRDLKSPNVLLNGITEGPNPVATIIDFGTSSALYGGAALIRCVDQPLWLGPEVLANTAYSEPSDVYSFGIILWELYTRTHPFDEFQFGQWMSKLEDEIIRGLRPTIPPTCPPEYVELIQSCWTHEPNSRPTFTSIVETLGQMKKKFAPLPFTHPPHIRNMMRKSRSSSISEAMLPSNLLHLNLNGIAGANNGGNSSPTNISGTSPSNSSILSQSLNTQSLNASIGGGGSGMLSSSINKDSSLVSASSLGNNTSTSSLASLVSSGTIHHSPSASDGLNEYTNDGDIGNTLDFFQDIFTEEENEQPYPFADDDQQKGILFGFDEEQTNPSASSVSIIIAATMAKMIEMMTKGESSATIKSDQIATRRRSDTAGKNGVPPHWRNSVPLSTNSCTSLDETFIDDFIYVYRSFTTPRNIFKLLVRRFFGPRQTDKVDGFTIKKFEQKKVAIRQGIAVFLRKWVADITELEFRQEEFWLYHNTVSFTKQFIAPEFPNIATQIFGTLATHEDEVNLTNQRFLQIAFSESEIQIDRAMSSMQLNTPKPFRSHKNLANSSSSDISFYHQPSSTSQSDVSRVFLNLATGMRDPLLGIIVRERKFKKDKVSTLCTSGSEIIDWITKCMPIKRDEASILVLDMLMKQFFIQISEDGVPVSNQKGTNPTFSDSPTSFYMFLEDDPEMVARQYTFLELKYLQNIHPRELLGFSVGLVMPNENEKDPEKWRQSNFPHIYDYFRWFNKMTMLVSTEILRQRDIKQRAFIIEKYIAVALEYLNIWNFNGIMQVLSSLHSEPISRLAATWSRVSPKSVECFHELSRLMLPESNYLPLRTALSQKPQIAIQQSPAYPNIGPLMKHTICPTIPFLGALIADLSQTCTENPTFISSGGEKMINILRVKRLSKKMKMFKEYKEMPTQYIPPLTTTPLQYYEHYVNDLKALDSLQIDRLSDIERKLEVIAEKNGTVGDDKEKENENSGNSLTSSNFFGTGSDELTERDWTILLTNASVIAYNRGDVVMEENAINTHLYRIKSGAISVEKKDKEGVNCKVATMLAPKMFGEMSFLGNKTTARLTVDEESDLYVMDIPFLNNLFNSHPRLGAKFYKIMANQLAIRLKNLPWSKPKASSNGSNNNSNNQLSAGPDNILGTTPTGLSSGGLTSLLNQNLSSIMSLSNSNTPPASPRVLIPPSSNNNSSTPPPPLQFPPSSSSLSSSNSSNSSNSSSTSTTPSSTSPSINSSTTTSNTSDKLYHNIHPTIQHRAASSANLNRPPISNYSGSGSHERNISGLSSGGVSEKIQSFGGGGTPRGDGARSGSISFLGRTQTSTSPLNEGMGQQPVMKKNDQEFCQRFALVDEIVIKDYPCSLNRSGRLYISQQHVCFYSKFFGYKTKKVIPFKNIDKLICINTNQIELTRLKNTVPSNYRLTFQTNKDRQDSYSMIFILWESSKQSSSSSDEIKNKLAAERKKVNNLTLKTRSKQNKGDELTKEDWELIGCEGSRSSTYKKDEVIIREGERMQKIFQIGKGVCRIEKSVPIAPGSSEMKKVVLGTMKQDDTFGEITYLLNGETTADVIADSDQTEVYTIEGQFVNILFDLNPALASKWFKYLATALNKTLIERESQLYA